MGAERLPIVSEQKDAPKKLASGFSHWRIRSPVGRNFSSQYQE